ncbi:MAG TPA: sodium:solute symporter [Phycisphaerae bacterium]|nr:sodium:solute symporter [Phycisphaerae bacterium]
MTGLETWDWIVIGLYFLALAVIVWWSSRRQQSSEDYFLAGRNIGWFVIGASLFASNIGSEHIVGLAGSGAKSGMAMAHYELHAWCLLVLGWVFVPFYSRAAVYTMPEFLERRYNPTARWILSLVSLVAYVFTKVSVTVYAGGVVFATLLPEGTFGSLDNFWVGAVSVVVLTGIYTVLGGLRAVVYTDALQAVVLIVGSAVITIMGLSALGGWGELRALAGSQHFNMWRPATDPDFPWAGILFGAPIVGLWYWCTDQYIVQRTLAARNMRQARRGTIWGAYLKLSPVFIFIVPGMIAYALAKSGRLELESPDQAFPALVRTLLPAGLRGLVVGGLLAALMSSLSSLFNSCSTLFTVDIYEKLRPGASERTLVRVGRIATGVVVVLGIAWIPVMQYVSGALYEYLQTVQAYLAPPITAAFFLGVFVRRINGAGAVAGMICGFVLGMAKLAAQVLAGMESVAGSMPDFLVAFGTFQWLYFCLTLFAVSVVVMVVVSLLTSRPPAERIEGLTFATITAAEKDEIRKTWNKWDVIHTIIILSVIAAVYLYFTG